MLCPFFSQRMECTTLTSKATDFPRSTQKGCDEYFKLRAATCEFYKAPLEGCNGKHQYILFLTKYSSAVVNGLLSILYIRKKTIETPCIFFKLILDLQFKSHVYSGSLKTSKSAPGENLQILLQMCKYEKFLWEKILARRTIYKKPCIFMNQPPEPGLCLPLFLFSRNAVPWVKLAGTFLLLPHNPTGANL